MPFTLAHPAAILPLRHVPHLRTAPLIIGAMAPDLPSYAPTRYTGYLVHESHRLRGSWSVDLAMGFALLVFVFVLRRPLTVLLPARSRGLCLRALAPYAQHPLEWLLAPVAILIGVWTHLLWDSFTHSDDWMVRRIEVLSRVVTIGPYTGELCHVLQYVSSVVGVVIVAVWYWRLRALPAPPPNPSAAHTPAAPLLLLAAAAAILIGGVQGIETYSATEAIYRTLNVLLTHTIAWFAVLYLVAGTVIALSHDAAESG
ncbi:MAG: DUF4184 family protein [Steroidobacteraceae bacterium]